MYEGFLFIVRTFKQFKQKRAKKYNKFEDKEEKKICDVIVEEFDMSEY